MVHLSIGNVRTCDRVSTHCIVRNSMYSLFSLTGDDFWIVEYRAFRDLQLVKFSAKSMTVYRPIHKYRTNSLRLIA